MHVTSSADVLAGESSRNDVHIFQIRNRSDIPIAFDMRPVFLQYFVTERVNLHLPFAGHTGTLQPQIHAADACE
jgi:hypothetical protein